MEIFRLRRRPRKDPIRWIRRGEYVEGDPVGSASISGVTNRPLMDLLENDQDLSSKLQLLVNLLLEVQRSGLDSHKHLDTPGEWLYHLDASIDPERRTYLSSSTVHHDHEDSIPGSHGDHNDHTDIAGTSAISYQDVAHSDHTDHIPHGDYTDHANSHGDHMDAIYVHQDAPRSHQDHHDHADYYQTGRDPWHSDFHTDHNDIQNFYVSSRYSDHSDYYDCSRMILPQVVGIACWGRDYHADYWTTTTFPPSHTDHTDGHGWIPRSIGYQHLDHYDGCCSHLDGHNEWFYGDHTLHNDYPPPHSDHTDFTRPEHNDHKDVPHVDSHYDHGDHQDSHTDHNDGGSVYVNYTDHANYSPPYIDHGDHYDHNDSHLDQPTYHIDRAAQSLHEDVSHQDHEDHVDVPHGDSGVGHVDYRTSTRTYHIDYTPPGGVYHLDGGQEHYDLAAMVGSHLDHGYTREGDVRSGIYEVLYPGMWHGDRVWHQDEDSHGDGSVGEMRHEDHSDIHYHLDSPHGDQAYQDVYQMGHLDTGEAVTTTHEDHTDGVPPSVLHQDRVVTNQNQPHEDHMDWIHYDYHLDSAHQDESNHLDRTTPLTEHLDYPHLDHADHSDWEHGDHVDADMAVGRVRHFVSYSDHGDTVEHKDLPHVDGTIHLDYTPDHTDHYDHSDYPHGDRQEEYLHEDFYTPESHLDEGSPHDDVTYRHTDAVSGGHTDYHADHTDHGDFRSPERHGDYTYSVPHLDVAHGDSSAEENHYDGPEGPAHQDLYSHKDSPHLDETLHTDRVPYQS